MKVFKGPIVFAIVAWGVGFLVWLPTIIITITDGNKEAPDATTAGGGGISIASVTAQPTTPTANPTNTPTNNPTPTPVRGTIQMNGETVLTPNIIILLADDMGFGDLAANYDHSPHPEEWTLEKRGAWLSAALGGGGTRAPLDGSNTCDDGSQWTSGGQAGQDYPIYTTTHLDSLATPGILFNAMHSASTVCSPTRASVLTGRLPGREKIDYVDDTGKNQMQASAWGSSDSESAFCIPQGQYTIANAARKKGYKTAFYGKWHLGNLHNSKTHSKYDNTPIDYGFQHYHGTTTNAATHDVTIHPACRPNAATPLGLGHYKGKYPNGFKHATTGYDAWSQSADSIIATRDEGEPFNDLVTGTCPLPTNLNDYSNNNCNDFYEEFSIYNGDNCVDDMKTVIPGSARGNSAEYLVDKATEFIDANSNGGTDPFFIEIATYHMHTPFLGNGNFAGTGSTDHDRYMNYKGTLQELDEAVGKLIQNLKDRGHWSNTMIIFTADNGQERGKVSGGSPGPYSGCKRELLEGGTRVPGLLQWPDVIDTFHHTAYPGSTYDLLPTVEDLLSQLPDDPSYASVIANHRYETSTDWDGESWKGIIEKAGQLASASFSVEQFERTKHLTIAAYNNVPDWAIYSKNGEYKYYPQDNSMYDLMNDPRETSPLSLAYDGIKNELNAEYLAVKTSYESSRASVDANLNSWNMCFGQS